MELNRREIRLDQDRFMGLEMGSRNVVSEVLSG